MGRKMVGHVRSNLVAYLALFVALSGTAYAGVAVTLPRNSVGTEQLRAGAVTKQKIAASVRRSLTGMRGPRGKRGPEGPPGAAGSLGGEPAGGDLEGNYPNPRIALGAVSAHQTLPSPPWAKLSDPRIQVQGFLNGWHDAAVPWHGPEHYFDFFGDLHLRGSIAGGTVSNSENGAALWFCGSGLTFPPAAFEVPTETAGGTFVPGEVEIVQRDAPPVGKSCGVVTVPVHWTVFEVRVVAGANNRVSLDGVSMYFDSYAVGG